MPRVFICYRREDSAGHAGRLYDHLKSSFGQDVFMDVEGIDGGIDFQEHIRSVVGSCDVLLALIGARWRQARLAGPDDLLRSEITAALERGIRVIPVLVDDARLPTEGLPDDLAPLARRQAMELRNAHWNSDVQKLIEVLKRIPPAHSPSPNPNPAPARKAGSFLLAAIVAACAGLVVLALVYPRFKPDQHRGAVQEPLPRAEPSTPVPGPATSPPDVTPAEIAAPTTPESPPVLACVQRWSGANEFGVGCQTGEVLAGGGCTCPGGTLRSSYPSPEGADGVASNTWQCDGQCPGGLKAVALCCAIAP